MRAMPQLLTSADFAPYLGKTFRPSGQHRSLTLVSIRTPSLPHDDSALRQPFILIFEGPPGDILPEGLYEVAVDGGPEFSLYISPVHTIVRDRQDYQAVFN
jgi:hypothetical protein